MPSRRPRPATRTLRMSPRRGSPSTPRSTRGRSARGSGRASATTRSTGPTPRPASGCCKTFSGILGQQLLRAPALCLLLRQRLRHPALGIGQRLPRGRARQALLRLHHRRPGLRRDRRCRTPRSGRARLHPERSPAPRGRGAEGSRPALRRTPPTRRAHGATHRGTTTSGPVWSRRRLGTAWNATARKRSSAWLWELWNEPDIFYWRGTPEQFNELYTVTARAVRNVLPNAQGRRPDRDERRPGVPAAASWTTPPHAGSRWTSSPTTPRAAGSRPGSTVRSGRAPRSS